MREQRKSQRMRAVVCALTGFLLTLPAVAAPIQIEVAPGDRIKATSEYWRLDFDLRNGGVLDSIVFLHGSGKNVLVEPFRTYVDGWTDADTPQVEFHQSETPEVVRLEFSGHMGSADRRAGPVSFHMTWTLSPFEVRADDTIQMDSDLMVSTVGAGSTAVRPQLNEFGLRVGPTDDPDRMKRAPASFGKAEQSGQEFIVEHHAPIYLLFFDRRVEGFDFTTASDLAAWESGLTGRTGVGRYEARLSSDGSRIRILREPLHVPRPLRVPKGKYTFSYYLGLPRIVEKANRKWRHLSFGNHPWPSDQGIREWAESGVNIVRLHNDYAPDGNFWHDGAWPPYDENGMAELRRVIATCHRYQIRVVPYFSIHEFHPQAAGYEEHVEEWKRSTDELGTVYHNHTRNGEYGAQMCPQSGWLERREHDVEMAYRQLGFDGIYYDWVMSLPCDNKNHNPKLHLGTDGVINLLDWTRKLIAPKHGTLILHIYGKMPSIAFENFADLVVNMEELSSAPQMLRMGDIPIETVLAESLPRSPCPSYRRDRELERNRNNIAQLVVQGMFPWAGSTGDVYKETLKLFSAFRPYHLENFRFYDAFSGAVHTAWPEIYGAVYADSDHALVVVSNTGNKPRKQVLWTVRPETLGFHQRTQVSVKDTKSGVTQTLPWQGLTDGTLETELDGYEYRIFEIRPGR